MAMSGREIDDENSKILKDHYDSSTGTFKKLFIGIILASLVFSLIILIPYIMSIHQLGSLKETLSIYDKTSFDEFVKQYDNVSRGFEHLPDSTTAIRDEFDHAIRSLNLFQTQISINTASNIIHSILKNNTKDEGGMAMGTLKNLSAQFQFDPNFYIQMEKKCSLYSNTYNEFCLLNQIFLNSTEYKFDINNTIISYPFCNLQYPDYNHNLTANSQWADCILTEIKNKHVKNFGRYYNDSISSPIKSMIENYRLFSNNHSQRVTDALENLLSADKKVIEALIDAKQKPIEIFNKTDLHNQQKDKNDLVESYQNQVSKLQEQTNQGVEKVRGAISDFSMNFNIQDIDERIANVLKQIEDTKVKLAQTQFPLATFPLELDSTVAIFPIAVAIGYIICIKYLKTAIYFRIRLSEWYMAKDPNNVSFDNFHVDKSYPLWINDSDDSFSKSAKYVILTIPLIICATASFLVLSTMYGHYSFTSGIRSIFGAYGPLIYLFLYSFFLFILTVELFSVIITINKTRIDKRG